jgi:ribonuclease HI
VKNMDLWQRILEAAKRHQVEWTWVRSHNGNVMNERADRLATAAREAAVLEAAARTPPRRRRGA